MLNCFSHENSVSFLLPFSRQCWWKSHSHPWEESGRVQASGQISQSLWGFPGGSDSKESICNLGDPGSIPGLGRSPGGGHGHLLQYACLENPHGQRSLVGYSPRGHKESDTTEQLSTAQHKLCPPNRKRLTDVENRPVLSQGEGEWERDDLGV